MPYTFKAVLNSKPRQDNLYSILIRVTLDRQRKSINTGEAVKKSEFNPKRGEVRKANIYAESINKSIEGKIKAAQEKVRQNPSITLEQMQLFMQGKEVQEGPRLLVDYFAQVVDLYYKGNLFQTRHYTATLNKWKEFEAHTKKRYLLQDVNIEALKGFEYFMKESTRSHSQSTRTKHMKRISRVYKLSVAHGVTAYHTNPFLSYELKAGKGSKKERLTQEEIKRLEDVKLIKDSMYFHVRNIWLSQMYCAGTRIGDMLTMKVKNVASGRLNYEIRKTEEQNSVLIPKKAMDIFRHYLEGKKPGQYIFPFLKDDIDLSDEDILKKKIASMTSVINKNLKLVASRARIKKNLTTHVARHTFADLARQKSKDIYGVSKALRHSSTKVTEAYLANFDSQAVDDVVNSVFDE